jgi:histidinol phosphatase-like enzyme
MKRAAFPDRDGVINEKPPEDQYVISWQEMQFLRGVSEAIALLTIGDYFVFMVSNQRGVLTIH